MRCKNCFLLLLLCGGILRINGQDIPEIESLLEDSEILRSEEGYEEILHTLMQLRLTPVNVNTAGFDSLKMLFLLSDGQIDQLLTFRRKYGCFLHWQELLLVPGIGRKDLNRILPFITLGKPRLQERTATLRAHTRQELLARVRGSWPLQEGYRSYVPDDFKKKKEYERKMRNRFQGPPWATLLKYKVTMNQQWQGGITLENDAGESFFTSNQRTGFDFLSAHLSFTSDRWLKRVIVGDYRIQWGQGLVVWGGFTSGKSAVTVGNEKSGRGFLPYTSTDENNFFRGVALSVVPAADWQADVFFSRRKTDGNLTPIDTLEEEDWLSVSLYESGYHRNISECRKKRALKECTAGLALHRNTPYFKVGAQALYYDFTPTLIPGDRLYQQYNDTGEERWLVSVDYKASFRGLYGFGEVAYSDRQVWATLQGLRWGNSFLSACLLYRYYDYQYVSRYAAGFGEYSNTSNEEGVYAGIDLQPVKNLKINFYYDWFRFFAPRYQASAPGSGWEVLGEVDYVRGKWEHIFRLKHEIRPEDGAENFSVQRGKSEYRYQLQCRFHPRWECRTRFSLARYHKQSKRETGYLAYEDVIYTSPNTRLKMQYRLAWFDTDSYQSRIYAYENNVLYGYSFPMFMGTGWRTYLNLRWKPLKSLSCYLKTGFIIYPRQETISSGLTRVESNRLYDLTFQLRFTF